MSGIITTLAQERRSQPQQILDLQAQYSDLVQRAALDSQALHTARLEHEAALVHFREVLDKITLELGMEYQAELDYFTSKADRAIAAGLHRRIENLTRDIGENMWQGLTFWQRVRWLVTGRA